MSQAMDGQHQVVEHDCVDAFKSGNKSTAEELLPRTRPANVRTTFAGIYGVPVTLVSLLHLSAYWGWSDVAILLVTQYNCSANWQDEDGNMPLYYAANRGHIEVVKYFVSGKLCDQMHQNKFGNTPLHSACFHGHLGIAKYLISEAHCNTSCKNIYGVTPLQAACTNGHLNIVQYFISEAHCEPSCRNNNGGTLLHTASWHGHLNIVKYFISDLHLVLSCVNNDGDTPLNCACWNGYLEIAQYFISEAHCDPSYGNNAGDTPLHYACMRGHMNIVQYLVAEVQCNPSLENNYGSTPLHRASYNGHLAIIQYLINEARCNPLCVDKYGSTSLHNACRNGHLNIVRFFIQEARCDPSRPNNIGDTPLHIACRFGHIELVQYLIKEACCDPSCVDKDGSTPLHSACYRNHAHIVQYLLSTGRVNPLAEDKYGYTPLSHPTCKYEIIKLFQPFVDCKKAFPVHTFTKLILTGDSGAGKTTTTQLLLHLIASRNSSDVTLDCVANVDRFTAGIVPHHIESELGNFVVYDFAGQQEYFSSHAAILEQVMRKSAAIFLCLIDISRDKDEICQSLQYWLSFIENACSPAKGTSHVVIVGSHADLVKSSEEMEDKSSLLQEIATRRVKHQEYVGYMVMDCRPKKETSPDDINGSSQLIATLFHSQKVISASQPMVSYYCHVLYAFLRTNLKVIGCTLQTLISATTLENDPSLPSDPSVLTELLTTLSNLGLILFINHPNSSWVVVKTEVLLNEINGTLFAPRHLKEYSNLASNTGIVPSAKLQSIFPHHSLEMILGFLQSLEFCCQVDCAVIQRIAFTQSATDLLFFPSLIQSEQPDGLIQQATLQFGWCLGCMDSEQFFSSRFLHVLLLSVAYKFPLASRFIPSSSLSGLQRMCIVWRNGISWSDDDDITVVVELLDNNRWVMVAMSCDKDSPVKHAKLRSSLISLVRHLQQERCPSLRLYECLISPELVQRYPFKEIAHTDLFDIHHVARSILLKKKAVRSYKDGCGRLSAQSLPFEPYQLLSPSSVCQLFNPSLSNQPVPASLLQEVQELCCHSKAMPLVYKELRHYLDSMSIFAGRNPLVSKQCDSCV